jgi:hypothetical protein
MTAKHAPGPWDVEYFDYGEEIWFGGEGCGTWYVGPCVLGGAGNDPEEKAIMDATARLIAAAPELLAACKACETFADSDGMVNGINVRAAIAKAEGRE